jgi:uncharacterized membrane protein YoaK (UPF0700 family)
MPIHYARRLTGSKRSLNANRHLGFTLAFIAGATNAGSFLAVHQYTSHMTGVVSNMADNLALGQYALVWDGLGGLLSFMNGAAASALMINYAQRRKMHSQYALPLICEAVLLLCFGLLGARLARVDVLFVPFTISLLCFIMGMQNAVITKISRAEIRTTHITGIVTDIGIELGKMLYWNSPGHPDLPRIVANRVKLKLLGTLALSFFVGGVVGALGFKHVGYASTIPLALLLILLAIVPAFDDVAAWRRRGKS